MMRAAIVNEGVVTNIVTVKDQEFADSQGWIISDVANKGDLWDGESFSRAPLTPQDIATARSRMSVERWQFATACMMLDIISEKEADDWSGGQSIPTKVSATLAQNFNGKEHTAARIQARSVTRLRRTDDIIALLAVAYQLTPEQVDEIFTLGMSLS